MDRFLAMVLAPFLALAMLLIARALSAWVWRKMPNGLLKRILFIRWR